MARTRTANERGAEGAGLWENIKTIVYALLLAFVVRTFVFEPFNIPSGSMIPTLLVGDYVFTEKWAYGYSHFSLPWSPDLFSGRVPFRMPHRGDVAVFRETNDTSIDYIKRIVGLPGDHVQMRGGELYLNGTLVPRTDLGSYTAVNEYGVETEARRYREMLPSSTGGAPIAHDVLKEQDDGPANDTPDVIVPPGCFFAMGDNRDDSADSRFPRPTGIGMVPMENLVGHAVLVFFSIDLRHPVWEAWYWPFEIRWSRLFTVIR